jgi:hypothetical protein
VNIWIPVPRFLAVTDHGTTVDASISDRLSELRNGGQEFIGLHTADRILTRLNLHHWFHIPADQGGLADIYEDNIQYGAPDRTHTQLPRPRSKRYATETERLEARRQTWRDSYARRKERLAA